MIEWIDATQRLPEDAGETLCYGPGLGWFVANYSSYPSGGGSWEDEGESWHAGPDGVTHWAELSTPNSPGITMSNDKAWDSDVYSAGNYTHTLMRFTPEDASGLAVGCNDELLWPVSFDQLQAWGWKEGDECSWLVEGPSLCWFTIANRRVAKGERNAVDGSYSWAPQCTCLDDEDSGGNRFKDWDEDCPVHRIK